MFISDILIYDNSSVSTQFHNANVQGKLHSFFYVQNQYIAIIKFNV